MTQHELHLKNWAMTIAADNDILDELSAHEITSEYPKMAIKTKIQRQTLTMIGH